MIIVTTPGHYTEIDGYASCVAYAELLNQHQKPARTFFAAQPNYSVPQTLRLPELENYQLELDPADEVIVLDISIPDIINKFIPESQIIELIDHHTGFEDYWHERLGDKAIIERIGAITTSVFEWWGECWDYAKMPPEIARLLLAGVLDNTLNFNASITTDRDHLAARKLAEIASTSVEAFAEEYFEQVSASITSDLVTCIKNDNKPFHIPKLDRDVLCAQLTLWDANILRDRQSDIAETMSELSNTWLCSILSITDKRNYIITNDKTIDSYLSTTLNLSKQDSWFVSDKLWLRKEIFAKILEDKVN